MLTSSIVWSLENQLHSKLITFILIVDKCKNKIYFLYYFFVGIYRHVLFSEVSTSHFSSSNLLCKTSLTLHADAGLLINWQPLWWWWGAKRLCVFGGNHDNWDLSLLHLSGHLTPGAGRTEGRKHTIPTHGALRGKHSNIWSISS